jgi:uncharacterized protein (DUF924 family)
VIVLDQFARNMFRDTPKMFAADAQALRAALEAVTLGLDRALGAHERVFLILPTMHSEQLAVQQQGVQLFSELRDQLEGQPREVVSRHLDYAIRHRDIIARFGRFPHRNAILGRESTREELEFLQRPGASR